MLSESATSLGSLVPILAPIPEMLFREAQRPHALSIHLVYDG